MEPYASPPPRRRFCRPIASCCESSRALRAALVRSDPAALSSDATSTRPRVPNEVEDVYVEPGERAEAKAASDGRFEESMITLAPVTAPIDRYRRATTARYALKSCSRGGTFG
jgi:hypothetical protein